MIKARLVAWALALLYVWGGAVGHLGHLLPEHHESPAGPCACVPEEGVAWEPDCQGPCSDSRHHHHAPSHDPHVCPTCQFLASPVLGANPVSLGQKTPRMFHRTVDSRTIAQKVKPVLPPLRAPPPHPFS